MATVMLTNLFDDSFTRRHAETSMSVGGFLVAFLKPLGMAADGRDAMTGSWLKHIGAVTQEALGRTILPLVEKLQAASRERKR